jgi:hypothetical protein
MIARSGKGPRASLTRTAAHSPQAKGRLEPAFGTDHERLVKGLRENQVNTLEKANRYLEQVFEPWWEATRTWSNGACTSRLFPGDGQLW